LVQLLISGTTSRPKLLASDASSTTTHRRGELDPSRYRLFPARLGSICCEPFEGEITDNPRGSALPLLANTTPRRWPGAAVN
jgi:hypothetical protein